MRSMMCWSLVIIAALPFGCIDDPAPVATRANRCQGRRAPASGCRGLQGTYRGYRVQFHHRWLQGQRSLRNRAGGPGILRLRPDGTPPSGTGDGGALPSTPPPRLSTPARDLRGYRVQLHHRGLHGQWSMRNWAWGQGMFACGPQGAVQ